MNPILLTAFALSSLGLLLRYPEIALALFLLSGTFKSQFHLMFPQVPDITIICGLILIAGVIIRLPISFPKPPPTFKFFLTFAGLVAMMCLSLFAANDNRYGWEKTVRFATLTGLALFTPLITVQSEKSLTRLQAQGIGCAPYFSPIHLLPFYRRFGYKPGDFPITEEIARRTLALPFYSKLRAKQVYYIADRLQKALKQKEV